MTPIEQALCREMHTFDALWHEIHLTLREIMAVFQRKETIIFFCLVGLTLITLDPHDFLDHISVFEAVFVWAIAETLFAASYFSLLVGIALLPGRGPIRIYLPIPSSIAFVIATLFLETVIGKISAGLYLPNYWPDILLFILVSQLFEFLFIRYVLPDVLADIRTSGDAGESTLQIGDNQWDLSDVTAVSSHQHYLQIDFTDRLSEKVRARISDVVDGLPPSEGLQPHRSWWVSRHADPRLISEGRKRWLITKYGHKIPVARGRFDEVQSWLDTYGPKTDAE